MAKLPVACDGVVPMLVDSARATQCISDWLGAGYFRPGNLTQNAQFSDVRPCFVPFWSFDCHVRSDWAASAGYTYRDTESKLVTRADGKKETVREVVEKVRWKPISGRHETKYRGVLVQAQAGAYRALVAGATDFRVDAAIRFSPGLVSGCDVLPFGTSSDAAWSEGWTEVKRRERDGCARLVPGDKQRDLSVSTCCLSSSGKRLLLPFWLATYQFQGRDYRVAVNGQTGTISGERPISWTRIILAIVALLAVALGASWVYRNFDAVVWWLGLS